MDSAAGCPGAPCTCSGEQANWQIMRRGFTLRYATGPSHHASTAGLMINCRKTGNIKLTVKFFFVELLRWIVTLKIHHQEQQPCVFCKKLQQIIESILFNGCSSCIFMVNKIVCHVLVVHYNIIITNSKCMFPQFTSRARTILKNPRCLPGNHHLIHQTQY